MYIGIHRSAFAPVNRLFLVLLALTWAQASCFDGGNDALKKKWVVVPGASFEADRLDMSLPACISADYPLSCPDGAGCCPEGYPFACPATASCYSQPPEQECPGYLTCAMVELQITSISPNDAALPYGQPITARVDFRGQAAAGVSDLVVQLIGISGRFERPLTQEEAQAGQVQLDIRLEDERPDLSQCLRQCSSDGQCGPCFVETYLPVWMVDFGLRDAQGTVWGTLLSHLNLSLATDPVQGCTADVDCADFCDFNDAPWLSGAPGAATCGGFCASGSCYCCFAQCDIDPSTGSSSDCRCLACDEGGTDCDWDSNLSCHTSKDVCLFFY